MNKDDQIIAIAEACGWLDIHRGSRKGIRVANGKFFWATKDAPSINYGREYSHVPSYLNDLNAMHEAWQLLTPSQKILFEDYLHNVVVGDAEYHRNDDAPYITNATARQRAEALLRTVGKWVD